jgi:glycosyltransferase involved in cell wall biosynthesis
MGKHILQLGPVPPPEGGISRNILAIREEVRRRGYRCSIIATSRSSDPKFEEDVHHPRSAAEFARLLAGGRYDLIHVHIGGNVTNRTLAVASAATIFTGRRSVFTLHSGGFPSTPTGQNAKPMSLPGLAFRRFGAVISINDQLDDVFKRYGVEKERIHRILPFSAGDPDPSVALPSHLRDFIEAHNPFLVAIGGLEKEYDPLFHIEAVNRIREEFPNAGLMIVGDGSMRREAEDAVRASAHGEAICLAGDVPHSATLHLISEATAMLRLTLYDGDAISVREALHLGTPAIVTDTGMRPAGTKLVRIGDQKGLIERIRESVRDGRGPVGSAGRENITAVADLYESLL